MTPILSTNMVSQNKYPFLPFYEEIHGAIKNKKWIHEGPSKIKK
jgi:hypothetical protein